MEVFGWVLLLILGLISWIIFVPIYLKIDTQKELYIISQMGTFHLSFTPGERPNFKVSVFGVLIPESKKYPKKPDIKKKRKPFLKRSMQSWLFLIKGLLKSFRIKRLVGTFDLDDVLLHSQLYAIYPFINRGPVQLISNLNNNYFLDLIIEGRLNKMLFTFLVFLTKK
ncbi:hypothetical protein P872_23530 [Rhodonellum psychrophilum GCM71 = DSM 17998]|uniref:DUF2953 domain-containing protein n=2 Tax=Rhodonellum TaxID=336827 RepID=U5C4D7_9BACT|nr:MULTISPECIES: hypothetical protein [Rhodonellum]ERM84684.1 hypothetical protein P872_23530 [Rhodonellum psychrophilum GCM71 = DSM 17998]SDZ13280.1 hypothetical protein SAMN05444412_106125 [Rhodonellum ikkaensis]